MHDVPTSEARRRLQPPATDWGQRPHLDGLRTVAVYLVVAYHAGLGVSESGFVGVDLFFTLSGYLVTMVLLQDLSTEGRIRLVRFYSRRARRLIPAATAAIIATSVGALMVSTPFDRSTVVGDATASSLWYANWHFLREASDYFAAEGPESPFIHFWSLSIEEQFYLAFPILLLAAWRLAPRLRTVAAVVAAAFALSVAAQVRLADIDVNRAYLGTDARAYQILAGSLLAIAFWRFDLPALTAASRIRTVAAKAVAPLVLGCFVVLATPTVDLSVSARGLVAASVATTLIASLELGRSMATAALSVPTMRYLGRISYGTYLWHWPVLVLAEVLVDMRPLAAFAVSGVVGTALAALSAEVIERPIRQRGALERTPGFAIIGGVVLVVVSGVVIAPAILESDRRPVVVARSSTGANAPVLAVAGGIADDQQSGGSGSTDAGARADDVAVPDLDWAELAVAVPDHPPCEQLDGSDCFLTVGTEGTLLLIGDSHARMLIPAFEQVAAEREMSLAVDVAQGCPWQYELLGDPDGDKTKRCAVRRELTYGGRIEAIDPDMIVVAGFPASVEGKGAMSSPNPDWQDLDRATLVEAATVATLGRLSDHGAPVLAVEPLPHLDANPVSCLSAATMASECIIAAHPEGTEERAERGFATNSDLVRTLDLDLMTCPTLPSCQPIIDDIVVRRDPHHLTIEFARSLTDTIADAADQAIRAPSSGS